MAVISIENKSQFEALMSTQKLTVAHFCADWVPQCEAMAKVLEIHASNTQDGNFCSIVAEDLPEISLQYNITNVPTFVMFHSGQVVGRVVGADAPQLTEKIQELLKKGAGCVPVPVSSAPPAEQLEQRLKKLISAAPVMLFMKGNAMEPRCGFSKQIVAILDDLQADYKTFDILNDEEVRQGLKKYSDWPTYPQLYIKGELIGGLDIVRELKENGELAPMLPKKQNLDERLKSLTNEHECMIFMKGDRDGPKCGFSRQLMEIMKETGVEFKTFDILQDEAVRQGLKTFSNWPTYPQIYVKGELIGGLDIIKELKESGELMAALQGNS